MGSRTNVGTNTWNWHALSNPYDWSSGYVYPIFNTTGCTGTYSYNTGGNNMGDNDNDYGNYNVGTVADCSVAYGSTLNMTGMGAQTITYGQNVVYVRYPSISTVSDTTPNPGQTGIVISGAGFETQNQYNGTSFGSVFTGTTSKLWLTNNINWGSETVKVAQTITNWTDTSVTFTCAQGGLSFGTVYLFVENSDGEINGPGTSNTGYAITLTNPSDPATTTGTLSVNSQTDTSFALNATYTGDDAPNDDNNCSMQYQDGSWLDITNEVVTRASKQWDGSVTAILKPGTTYNVQATFTDAQGVSGTNPLTTTATTTYLGLGVGTVTVTNVQDAQVQVNAPVDSTNSDTDSNATVQYQYNDGGGWTPFGSAVAAKGNQSMVISGLSPNTNYDFRVVWSDGQIFDSSTRALLASTSYNSNTVNQTTAYNGTTVGTLSTTGVQANQVSLEAAFSGDNNADNLATFDWKRTALVNWSTATGGSRGSGVYTITIANLAELTSYDFRVTFSDTDGLYGTNPATLSGVSTPSACDKAVNDCMDCHGMPPGMGDHTTVASHKGDGTRWACAVCHYDYANMANVTSLTKWTEGHSNGLMNIYTGAGVNGGISGGYYKGLRNASSLWEGGTPNSNNVCSNTYCHGANSPIWGVGSVTCGSCHALPPDDSGPGGSHSAHTQGYVGYKNNSNTTDHDYGCWKCHPEATHSQGPATATSAAYVAFSDNSSPSPMNGTYAAGSLLGADADGKNVSAATCTNALYCHSDGAGGNANSAPTWGTANMTCSSCHDYKPSLVTNSHGEHLSQGNLGVFNCIDCHNVTLSNNSTIGDKSLHVNGQPDVDLASGAINGSKQCQNNYCHSSGQAAGTGTPAYRTTPVWGVGALDCDGCHGAEGATLTAGAPEYANNSTAERNFFNGHWVTGHITSVNDCIKCHNDTVTSTGGIKANSKHLDGSRQVVFELGGTYANKRCSGTASGCHSGDTPRWGGSIPCQNCHADNGAIGTEVDDYTFGNAPAGTATINMNEYNSVGHGLSTASKYTFSNNSGAGLACEDCHDSSVKHNLGSNPFRLSNANPNTLCATCHDATQADHHNQTNTGGNGDWNFTPKCVDCHDPHGDYSDVTGRVNRLMIQGYVNYSTASSTPYGVPTFTKGVGFPDNGGGAEPGSLDRESFVQSDFSGLCQICHTAGGNPAHYSRSIYETAHSGTAPCTDCHTHPSGFEGAGSCTGCHGTGGSAVGGPNNLRNIQTDMAMNSHHINATWASIDPKSCAACHAEGDISTGNTTAEHNKDGVVRLKVWTTGGFGGSFTVQSYASGSTTTTFCLGCHDTDSASATPFTDSGDSGTPTTYSWDGSSVESRYSNTGTTSFSKYNSNTYNVVPQITKAYSPHGNASGNQRGVATTGAWANDGGSTNVQCDDCHNAHSSNVGSGTVMNSYSSAVGGWAGAMILSTGSYTPAAGGSSGTKNVYTASSDLCFDCHLGDDDGPKDFNTGFNNSAEIRGYYDTTSRWSTAATWSGTFSLKNGALQGGHLGASSALSTTPTNQIAGRCTMCHDPHGVATGKANAEYYLPALKGTWLTSPFKEDSMPNGSWTPGTRDTNTRSPSGTGRTAGGYVHNPRQNPKFAYNNPQYIGGGYGTGISGTTYGIGGTGQHGYFIDDNTFGGDVTQSASTGRPVANTTSTATRITQDDTLFAGLCTGCHTPATIGVINYSNGTDTIYVHRTVKGWTGYGTAADIFKNTNSYMMQHGMGFIDSAGGSQSSSVRCSTSDLGDPISLPGGYSWTVHNGANAGSVSSSGALTAPSTRQGQWVSGYTQTMHEWPCSKCHTPHTSRLPRLMRTNCLDVGTSQTALQANKTWNSYSIDLSCDSSSVTMGTRSMHCHNQASTNTTGGGGWNTKTGW